MGAACRALAAPTTLHPMLRHHLREQLEAELRTATPSRRVEIFRQLAALAGWRGADNRPAQPEREKR